MTNDLSYLFLEVIDEMSPILEPKPNVRLHKNTPEKLLDKVCDMIASSQGAPFLLNFDERSMAGLLREAKFAGVENLINQDNVFDYSGVGCLENTMVGNDRSSTVDVNLNFLKAVELTLGNGKDIAGYTDALWGKPYKNIQMGPKTGDPRNFKNFDEFYAAFTEQIRFIIQKVITLYNEGDEIRAEFLPTPYLSCLVKGCAEKGKDVTQGGAELRFITVEGVTFATTIDSLLAIKYLVYDTKACTMEEMIKALRDNWEGHEVLQARAKNKAPKYGRDDSDADELARKFMEFWSTEVPKYKGPNGQVYRGGMLSWNYWVSDGYVLCASPDGRRRGQFLSNAICPSNGADSNGPTANSNSVGNALGGRDESGAYVNYLPNGASHTITMSPSLMRDDEHRTKFKAFLRGYAENGGTALQINVLDVDTLRDAQKNPEDYRHLLVRVTGYNAYFTSIGRELQNEIIDRESHGRF
jgi:formate C-acetyltransferase